MDFMMEINILNWCMAAAPIILLIVLMAVLRWSASKAAMLTLAVTAASAVFVFQADAELLLFESLKGIWNSAAILWIIFPAILLYEVITEAGCIDALNSGLEKISPHELFKILTIGWVFAGFLQGITGFGVPVAICVPILMGMGVKPVMAAAVSLLGQAWGNTFGTLAVAWDMLADLAGLEGDSLLRTAWITAVFLWLLDLVSGLFHEGAAGRIMQKTWKKVKPSAVSVVLLLIISKLMSGTGQTLLIAQGVTMALGDRYMIVCGFLGLVGSFITGSNMSSNILFTDVQVNAALNLGTDSAAMLAAQTSGAAAGSMISPGKIILGTTSGGIAGKEGEILRLLLPLAVGFTLAVGVIARFFI